VNGATERGSRLAVQREALGEPGTHHGSELAALEQRQERAKTRVQSVLFVERQGRHTGGAAGAEVLVAAIRNYQAQRVGSAAQAHEHDTPALARRSFRCDSGRNDEPSAHQLAPRQLHDALPCGSDSPSRSVKWLLNVPRALK
jgi:hypothetical protein